MMEFARLAASLSGSSKSRHSHQDHRQIQNVCSIVCNAGYQGPLGEMLLNLVRQRAKESLLCIAAPFESLDSLDYEAATCRFMLRLSEATASFLRQQALLDSAFQVLHAREELCSLRAATNDLLVLHYGKALGQQFRVFCSAALRGCDAPAADESSSSEVDATSWAEMIPDVSPWDCLAHIRDVGWDVIFNEQLWDAVEEWLQSKSKQLCEEAPEGEQLPAIREWEGNVVHVVLRSLFGDSNSGGSEPMAVGDSQVGTPHAFQQAVKRVERTLQRAYIEVRARGMFELIADFPESTPALEEFAAVLKQTGEFHRVGSVLRETFEKRLLHAGASSNQILEMYISTIRAIRVLDPTDLLLEYATTPVRRYLQRRKDTVRCVVASLMEGDQGDLQAELQANSQPLDYGADSDDEDAGPGESWMPRKRDPRMIISGGGKGGLDVLALVVSIYGSRDLFVNEYRNMLAEKLLSHLSYDTDQEVRTLELLKIRFGDEILHTCEIMLRDIEESKRVNTAVHKQLKAEPEHKMQEGAEDATEVIDTMIISGEYWPGLQEAELTLHPAIDACVERYGAAYGKIKAPRHLNWMKHIGVTTIDLDFDNGVTRTFTVSPPLATLISHVADTGSMTSRQLAELTGLEDTEVVTRMNYWVNRGVVSERQSPDEPGSKLYTVIEDQTEDTVDADEVDSQDAMDDGTAVSSEAQERAARSTFQSYVMGMLTNVGSMSIEKIHSMLRMVASSGDHRYDMSIIQLRAFLQSMIEEDKLEKADGEYVLRKR